MIASAVHALVMATALAFAVRLDPAVVLLDAAEEERAALEVLEPSWRRAHGSLITSAGGTAAVLEPDQRQPGAAY